jgi:hypothetical protein
MVLGCRAKISGESFLADSLVTGRHTRPLKDGDATYPGVHLH